MGAPVRTERKVQAAFAFALALLSMIGMLSYRSLVRLREDAARVARTHEVIGSIRLLLSTVTDSETAQRGYTITGQESYLAPHDDALRSLDGALQKLRTLTADDADRQRQLGALARLIAERMEVSREIVALRRDRGFEAARAATVTGRGKQIQDRIRQQVAEMEEAEEVLLHERDVNAARSSALTRTVIVVGSVVAFGFVGAALFVIKQDFSGRARAAAALRAAHDRLEARVLERTADLLRTNESLRESHAQFETAFESLSEGLVVSALDGQLLHWNQAAVAMHGFDSPAEGLRRLPEFADIFELSTLDGAALPLDQWPLSRVLSGEQLSGWEIRIRRTHDDWHRIFSYGGRLVRDEEGRAFLAVVSMSDITQRQRAEETIRQLNTELEQRVIQRTEQLEAANSELRHSRAELNSLFESLPGLYLVLTPDLKIVAASDAYLKATLTTREGILGRDLFEVFPDNPDDPGTKAVSNMRASIDRVIQNAATDTMAIAKHDVRGPDGVFQERYWSPVNTPLFGADRKIKYIVHRVEEVTDFVRNTLRPDGDATELRARLEQMQAEVFHNSQEVQAINQQLEAANKELEAFSYSVSHDLRAPLRTVDGFSQALLEDFGPQLPEEGQRQVRTIREGAQRMGALIDDLLAFSHLGRQSVSKLAVVDMDRLVREALEGLVPERQGRQIEIRTAPLPPGIGDNALLKQVWTNLLSNALKYTRKRDPAVVEIGSVLEDGETVYFVRDNGTGFDMRYAHKLFGVFQRLHRPEDFEGTGVGLAIVQRIVHRHGGRVWAESALDRGATFHFTLPRGAAS